MKTTEIKKKVNELKVEIERLEYELSKMRGKDKLINAIVNMSYKQAQQLEYNLLDSIIILNYIMEEEENEN